MGNFTYTCKYCGRKYDINESWIGIKIKCQSCGKKSVVRMPEINNQTPTNHVVRKSTKENSGCMIWLMAASPLLFGILIGCGNLDIANLSIPIGLVLTIVFSFCAAVASTEDPKEKKKTAIFLIVLSIILILVLLYSCISSSKPDTATTSQQPDIQSNKIKSSGSNISRTQVISDTRKALELAQQVSGVTATGFHADNVLIGTDKATCHFTCYVNGRKHIGGMEFRISGNRLIPTGQYYLDPD